MTKRALTYEDFWNWGMAGEMDLSPDGRRAAYVVQRLDRDSDEARSAIWVVDLQTRETRQVTEGMGQDSAPRWSPDGRWMAYLSGRKGEKTQLYMQPAEGGTATRLTECEADVRSPVWMPDSESLVFALPLPSPHQSVPSELEWAIGQSGRKDAPQLRLVTEVKYRWDGQGYIDRNAQLFWVSRSGGEPEQLTSGEFDNLEPAPSPDGRTIAFLSNRTPDRWRNYVQDVWLLDLGTREERCLTDGTMTISGLSWSPEGQEIAYYAQKEWANNPATHTHVYAVTPEGKARDLTPAFDRSHGSLVGDHGPVLASPPVWSRDGATIYFTASDRGSEVVYMVPAGGGDPVPVSPDGTTAANLALLPDGSALICVAATSVHPTDVARLSVESGEMEWITDVNGEVLAEVELATPERFTFQSVDGWDIEGWLFRPIEGAASPLVLHIHGGPHSMYGNTFYFNMQVLAGAGIASLFVNPRGSGGYGETFMRAADWGGKDYQDLMNGLDHAIAMGGIDETRLAATGGSYGGFMTNWMLGHTDRFACGVSINGLSNLISFYGTADIGALWTVQQLGAPYWEAWDLYREHSPLTYIDRINTPLLILHAEKDFRVPIEQGEQMFVGLRMRGCEVQMVRIPGASHSLANTPAPRHRIERWLLSKAWFDRYFRKGEPS